ncbi:uncharacterized protein A4U43_C05F35780 [Asparagus officinalis]|uniref:DUF599 domain-containing protein n=1 Tax=Asparagus officinalis TaxID=4686 RepID=A0A5P1EXP9_ASPOF|nr:uncharacterized protein LOC109841417 [Asparagus officinalis]ONK70634.1 uncharacterized protein A4U43_C05F35780 [Asparagus officinalis]
MEWRAGYLDMILVPLGITLCSVYHVWLWRVIKSRPHTTDVGVNSAAQRRWAVAMIEENGKKHMVVVQSIRNAIMASTLMATTSILLCTGLAAILSSTYSVKKPLNSSLYGAHQDFMIYLKFVTLLFVFLLTFICYTLSIRIMNQACFLINIPNIGDEHERDPAITVGYICDTLNKGFLLHGVGNRLFYAAIPLLLWMLGPSLVFCCYLIMLPMFYATDIVRASDAEEEPRKIYTGV